MGIGLLSYAFWRFLQSFTDPENIGEDKKGIGKRIGFFFSGVVYLGLGIYSIVEIFSPGSRGKSEKGNMPLDYLPYIFYAVGVGLMIKALFQFTEAYKGDFLAKFHLSDMSSGLTKSAVKWLAYLGMISRGIVVGIVSYFFFRAADTAGASDIKGTADAFTFMNRISEDPWLVGLVALGLFSYGFYMFAMAKYRKFKH